MDPPRTFPPSQGAANFAADMATGPTCPHCGAAIDITEANRGACDLCAAGGLANPQATS